MSKILQREELVFFACPGCKRTHAVNTGHDLQPVWSWNGSHDAPTFSPSVLVTYDGADAGAGGAPPARCHSFVRDGKIEFLNDCTHNLVGQTVDLEDISDGI